MRKFLTITFFSIIFVMFYAAFLPQAMAQLSGNDGGPDTDLIVCGDPGEPECNFSHLMLLARNFVNFLILMSSALVAVSFVYAGFMYLTAEGDPGKAKKGREIFTKAAIGFVFVLSAWLIVNTIVRALLKPEYIMLQ